MRTDDSEYMWLPIIGRLLSHMLLQVSEVRDSSMGERAELLDRIGLPRKEIASLLGTTDDSIRALLHYASKSKEKKGQKKQVSKKGVKRNEK